MRFSLILMSFVSVQRALFLSQSIAKLTIADRVGKRHWSYIFIIIAFILAYLFEFFGLNIFCSKSNNRNVSYQWFLYLVQHLPSNSTELLISLISNKTTDLQCVEQYVHYIKVNFTKTLDYHCSEEKLMKILSHYFDSHEQLIVRLIQQIQVHSDGFKLSRNEIRVKYHYHGLFGSILPSIITIVGNTICVQRVLQLKRLTKNYLSSRSTDDTRRILVIITTECALAVINSWFIDILLSVVYCKRSLIIGDDCPMFLRNNYDLLTLLDFFNSMSNILLHCICGKRFRRELIEMIVSFYTTLKTCSCICCRHSYSWNCEIRAPVHWQSMTLQQHVRGRSGQRMLEHVKNNKSSLNNTSMIVKRLPHYEYKSIHNKMSKLDSCCHSSVIKSTPVLNNHLCSKQHTISSRNQRSPVRQSTRDVLRMKSLYS
ncbi:unnamed protein product [Didymodactylos carnosus]|uniref:Gustatory receptor n=1 Tax=Didymodactylos carnosus TaxID=1234261 RepID=A0A815E4I9_9BILA|nr:unnamed protein product [Didymodactylos carnosus]CAF1307456.1 unnamed protein product [Didymodactylos carnosus]CAF3993104.1 unnamed protein product [Didymodactylos carnosus]CAF4141884.1 unnamed protein product [Didymodactylos carnosus]